MRISLPPRDGAAGGIKAPGPRPHPSAGPRQTETLRWYLALDRPALAQRLPLRLRNGSDSKLAKGDKAVELVAAEGRLFAGALYLNQPAVAGRDQVQIHLDILVLRVTEVQEWDAVK